MPPIKPRILTAFQREAHVPCAVCGTEIVEGDTLAICPSCGSVQHQECWNPTIGCTAYECAAPSASTERLKEISIKITSDELFEAKPLEPALKIHTVDNLHKSKWNRTSLWAFFVALLGIPLFGIITGLVAMLLACIALVTHRSHQRGIVLASLAMVIGLADILGWAVALSSFRQAGSAQAAFAEMSIDIDSLDGLPKHIARAMRANVLIDAQMGIGQSGLGSGVVLRVIDGLSFIVTNRHVIDGNYKSNTTSAPKDFSDFARLTVGTIGSIQAPASVEWVAPNGIDLALISARLPEDVIKEAHWDVDQKAIVGQEVFAIGNPHGLGWTHTSGAVSQIRRQSKGGYSYRILQTSAAINPGNSGGGLYDSEGRLVGINTMTAEKRFAEGLGFSISQSTLLDLLPDEYGIRRRNPEIDQAP